MTKRIIILFKKITFSILLLYSYNIMVSPLNLAIPINIITISGISLLGLPALISFITILLIAF